VWSLSSVVTLTLREPSPNRDITQRPPPPIVESVPKKDHKRNTHGLSAVCCVYYTPVIRGRQVLRQKDNYGVMIYYYRR